MAVGQAGGVGLSAPLKLPQPTVSWGPAVSVLSMFAVQQFRGNQCGPPACLCSPVGFQGLALGTGCMEVVGCDSLVTSSRTTAQSSAWDGRIPRRGLYSSRKPSSPTWRLFSPPFSGAQGQSVEGLVVNWILMRFIGMAPGEGPLRSPNCPGRFTPQPHSGATAERGLWLGELPKVTLSSRPWKHKGLSGGVFISAETCSMAPQIPPPLLQSPGCTVHAAGPPGSTSLTVPSYSMGGSGSGFSYTVNFGGHTRGLGPLGYGSWVHPAPHTQD